MREERTNRKTTSIARKIHVGYWFRRFFALLGLDIVRQMQTGCPGRSRCILHGRVIHMPHGR